MGYAVDFLSQKRPFGSIGTAQGDHMGQELTAATQLSLPMDLGNMVLTPRAGVRFAYFHGEEFGETGAGGQNLFVGKDDARSFQPYAEVTLDKAFGSAMNPKTLQLRLGYAQELYDTKRVMTVRAQDGTLFNAPGTNMSSSYVSAGVGVNMQVNKALSASFGYDTVVNTDHFLTQTASAKVDYRF